MRRKLSLVSMAVFMAATLTVGIYTTGCTKNNNKENTTDGTESVSDNDETKESTTVEINSETTSNKEEEVTTEPAGETVDKSVMYSKSGAVIYTSPDKNSEKVVKLYQNSSVKVYEKTGDWYRVAYNGNEGYVPASKLVEKRSYTPLKDDVKAEKRPENIRNLDPDKPMVALTFDDGPSEYTNQILDALEENNQAATFFVVGKEVSGKEWIIKKAYRIGCNVGVHTYNHANLRDITDEDISWQVNTSISDIKSIIPQDRVLLRPPYGAQNERTNKLIEVPLINWSVDTLDWKLLDADKVYEKVMSSIKDGYVILMHDSHETSVDAAVRIIKDLTTKGWQLVTIEEMAHYKGVTLENGKLYRIFN